MSDGDPAGLPAAAGPAAAAAPTADAGLPADVAAVRRRAELLLARWSPAGAPEARGGPTGSDPPQRAPRRPTVLLAGAPGRGRRALAAALLGVATLPGRPERLVHGEGWSGPGDDGVLTAPVPLLEELDLAIGEHRADGRVDTAGATALLVLVDAGAPLDAAELAALTDAADRVDAVLFALVRVEAHRGWRTVLDADRALVAERLPRLADAGWFPVSPALAARAGTAPGAGPAALRERAGVAPLQRALHDLVARRARMLGEANALRACSAALHAVADRADATHAALRPGAGADTAARLTRRRDELAGARTELRRGRHVRWRTELATARIGASDDLTIRVRALSASARHRIDTAQRDGLAAVPGEVASALEALAGEVVTALGERLRGLVTATLADLLSPEEIAALRVPAPRAEPAVTPVTARGTREDRLLVVAGASGGLGLSRLALLPLLALPVVPAVLGATLVPISVGLGLGAAGWMTRARRVAADRAHQRQWLAEALGHARADLDRMIAEALVATEREVTLALDDALDRRAADLDAAARAAETAAREGDADRAAAARVAERTAADARAGAREVDAVLARLAHLRDRT